MRARMHRRAHTHTGVEMMAHIAWRTCGGLGCSLTGVWVRASKWWAHTESIYGICSVSCFTHSVSHTLSHTHPYLDTSVSCLTHSVSHTSVSCLTHIVYLVSHTSVSCLTHIAYAPTTWRVAQIGVILSCLSSSILALYMSFMLYTCESLYLQRQRHM